MNQVGNGFGLGEIKPAVEKRAFGKLSRLGQSRAVLQHRVQHQLRGEDAAVTGDFDHVFASERARGAHDGEQDFIHGSSLPHDPAVMNRVSRRCGWLRRGLTDRQKAPVRDRQRLGSGKTDHRQTAFAQRRCNRGYGVVEHE